MAGWRHLATALMAASAVAAIAWAAPPVRAATVQDLGPPAHSGPAWREAQSGKLPAARG